MWQSVFFFILDRILSLWAKRPLFVVCAQNGWHFSLNCLLWSLDILKINHNQGTPFRNLRSCIPNTINHSDSYWMSVGSFRRHYHEITKCTKNVYISLNMDSHTQIVIKGVKVEWFNNHPVKTSLGASNKLIIKLLSLRFGSKTVVQKQ